MRKLKIILGTLLGMMLLLLLSAHLLLQYRARQVLQRVVEDLSDGHYTTRASKVEVGYFPVGVRLQSFALQPTRSNHQLLSFSADSIDLKIGSIWALLLKKKLDVQVIHLHKPSLVAYAHHHAHADSSRQPVAQTIAAIQQKLFQAFTELDVRDASIADASIKIINAQDESKYFSINHVNLSMLGFDVSPELAKTGTPVFQQGNITLNRPDIHLEDSSLQIQLGKLMVNGIKGDVEIDSLDIAYQTPQEATEKIRLNSIDIRNFNWARYLQEGFFEVDSILIDKGEATLDLTKRPNTKPKKATQYQGSSFLVHHAAISNVTYALQTKDYVEKNDVSVMRLQGDRLSVDELSILKNRTPALDVGALNVHISNFTETDTSSLYAASLSDLAIQSDALILRNYQLTERKTERSKANRIVVPELRLEGYSLSDLLLRRLIANKLTVMQPNVSLHVLGEKKSTAQNKNINQRVDLMLRKIEESIQLNEIVIHQASISLIPQQSPNEEIKLLGLSLSIDGNKAVKATNVMELIHAINRLETKGFTLAGKNILLKVTDAQLLNAPRGFFFGSIKGQFGENAQIDLRGVTILNADNDIDLTSIDGLNPSHVSVQSGSITILQKNNAATGAATPLPTLRVGQLDLSNVVLKMQQENKLAASSAFDLQATGFLLENGIASWRSLQIGSEQNELESGNTFFKAGSMELEQPGVMRIRNAKGNTQKNNTQIAFSIEEMEAGFGISNSQPDELRVVSLQLKNPTLRIQSTKTAKTAAATAEPSNSTSSKPVFLQHLSITNPNIDFVLKNEKGDTLHYSNTLLGQLQCEDVSITHLQQQPQIQIGSLRYVSQQLKAAFAEKLFNPSGMLLALSNIRMLPASKQIRAHVDTAALYDISHTLLGKQQDTTTVQIAILGMHNFQFNSSDSIQWKQLLTQQQWWMQGANIAHNTPTQTIQVHGLQAHHTKALQFSLDSMQLRNRLSREAFWLNEPFEKDYISVATGKITGTNVHADFTAAKMPPLYIGKLTVDKAILWPQRDKTRPEDTVTYRPLLAQQILSIPLPLHIDSVLLSNSQLRYNEIGQKTGKEGKIFLDNINGFVANVKTHDPLPNDSLIMIVNARLYGKGQTRLNFRQSYTDSLQGFWMRVRMGNMNMQEMNAFLRPQMGLQIKSGIIDTLTLLINGNKYFAYGTMDLRYHKMSVRLLSKKDGSEQYFLAGTINWLANQIVRRHDNGRPNLVFKNRVVKRGQFNYLSKIGVEGLLTNIGIKTDRKERKKFKKNLHKYKLPTNYWGNDDL